MSQPVELRGCSTHNYRAIVVNGHRITGAKCCGKWDVLLATWRDTPEELMQQIRAATQSPEAPNAAE